jgi:hypothetical protein
MKSEFVDFGFNCFNLKHIVSVDELSEDCSCEDPRYGEVDTVNHFIVITTVHKEYKFPIPDEENVDAIYDEICEMLQAKKYHL